MLFPNDGIVTILARIVGMLGPIDLDMLVKGQETDKYFTNELDLYHINEVHILKSLSFSNFFSFFFRFLNKQGIAIPFSGDKPIGIHNP